MSRRFALLLCALALSPIQAKAQWRTSVLPVIGSAPETGGQFGVALFRTRQADDTLGTRPTSIIGNAILTSKSQQRAFVEYDRWTAGNERRLQVLAIASKFPLPFYGFGDDSPDFAFPYEPTTLDLSITRSRRRGVASWRYVAARIVSTSVNGSGGSPCDSFCFLLPETAFPSRSYGLGLLSVGVIKDSRDNLFAPTRGRVFDVSLAAGATWPDFDFKHRSELGRLRVDWREYRPLRGGGVLAGQLQLIESSAGFPIDQVAMLGHHTLNRGYTMGRFRDRGMLSSQLEWRSATRGWNERLGVATFAGVAYLLGSNSHFRPFPSAGAGLRFRLDPRTRSTIRVDYARGVSGQSGLYVAFNEAF